MKLIKGFMVFFQKIPLIIINRPKIIKTIPIGKAMSVQQRITPIRTIMSPKMIVRSLPRSVKRRPINPQISVKGNKSALIIQPI